MEAGTYDEYDVSTITMTIEGVAQAPESVAPTCRMGETIPEGALRLLRRHGRRVLAIHAEQVEAHLGAVPWCLHARRNPEAGRCHPLREYA